VLPLFVNQVRQYEQSKAVSRSLHDTCRKQAITRFDGWSLSDMAMAFGLQR